MEIRFSFFGTKCPRNCLPSFTRKKNKQTKQNTTIAPLKTATNFATSSTKFETKIGSCFEQSCNKYSNIVPQLQSALLKNIQFDSKLFNNKNFLIKRERRAAS